MVTVRYKDASVSTKRTGGDLELLVASFLLHVTGSQAVQDPFQQVRCSR